jgi:hypothetical protein
MSRVLRLAVFVWFIAVNGYAATGTSVSWSIGKVSSTVDGVANAGSVTFTWTFDREVTYGTYVDGTPWVIWEDGLQLVSVSPAKMTMNLPDVGSGTITNGVTDATCINPGENHLPLDQRLGGVWSDGNGMWNENPVTLQPGDCIVTGQGRRTSRSLLKRMVFTAVGACNIVTQDMTGHFRPPIRIPRDNRAGLFTPRPPDVSSFEQFSVPAPKNWAGSTVNLLIRTAATTGDADDLLNGPFTNYGIYGHNQYQYVNGMLNHNLSGTDDVGYQRNVADRFATCLFTAFDPTVALDKRQRSLNKFIQTGLDCFYQYCLGYPVGNGGGGHCNGLEGLITLTGALLGDSVITNAIKFQRFPGSAVGRGDTLVDMFSGGAGALTRTEACYLVAPGTWRSGEFVRRSVGAGAGTIEDAVIRFDFAREDHVTNNKDVPFTALATVDSFTAVTIDGGYTWDMHTLNSGTAKRRSYGSLTGGVARLSGDNRIRKIMGFNQTATQGWSESTWEASGQGGVLLLYPALTAAELTAMGQTGTITTGICTWQEAINEEVIMWDAWSVDNVDRVLRAFFAGSSNGYLGIKLYDNFHWLPFYHLLDDPGAPGKKMYEESPGYKLLVRYMKMQLEFGAYFWDGIKTGANVPKSAVIQALSRHYLFNDQLATVYCKTYDLADQMWTDEVGIIDTWGKVVSAEFGMRNGEWKNCGLYTLDGKRQDRKTELPAGVYLVLDRGRLFKKVIVK